MKSYISTCEITTLVSLAHLLENIDEILKKDISKEEKTDLKYLRTYTKRYIHHAKERIDKKSDDRLKVKVKNYVPKLEPVRKYGDPVFNLAQDDFYDLVEEVMAIKCCDCPGVLGCRTREVLHDNFIPILTVTDESNPCEYMYKFTDLKEIADDCKKM
ncbi:hypothetical protein SAMN04515656_10315 [Eubacterium aggregans]|uniref:DUF5651 domain-containing protein n=1 Tax=Eubacterium aggregans TaxID=81409 RepID=A0A1H3Y0I2_9FIRM|nr:hypothetical protein SAMN04515656_10315 [Eubacterium aggregans]